MTNITSFFIDYSDTITVILILSSIVIFTIVSIIYFKSNDKKKATIQTILTMFGNFILILNIMFIIYNKVLDRINQKITHIKDLNKLTLTLVNNIFTLFYKDPKNLSVLHQEIFNNKINENPSLSYEESNILFIIFQTIESVYRMYYVSGKESTKLSKDQYEGWDNFLLLVTSSPKAQLFYKSNKHLFSSLNFEDYIAKYFKQNKIYVEGLLD